MRPAYVCVFMCVPAFVWVCVCARRIIKSTNTKTSTQTVKAMIDSVDIRFLASKRAKVTLFLCIEFR